MLFFRIFRARARVFVDVGAFDGESYSNVRLLYENGWSGICIEPAEKNYAKLEAKYRDTAVRTVRAAVSDREGVADLAVATIPGSEGWGSDVSTLDHSLTALWPDYEWEVEQVPMNTLDHILTENRITEVDFLSIDVEGHELAVLRGLDLERFRPALIVAEAAVTGNREQLLRHCDAFGYRLWIERAQDVFLVRGSRMKLAVLRAASAITRYRRPM